MPSENQKKNFGRYIVIGLCIAIVIFLLLPLLDDTPGNNSLQQQTEKAEPQLFASNPLTDLVNKIYSLFSRGNKRMPSMVASASAEADWFEEPNAPVRATVQVPTPQNSSAAAIPADSWSGYGYIDESGSWIEVQQTAPESSQRGLHEITTSDPAYDRLMAMRRQAKYTGGSVSQIPQSKWARLWKPIKQFFTRKNETSLLASAQPAGVELRSFAKAGSSASSEQGGSGIGQYQKPNTDWDSASPSFQAGSSLNDQLLDALLLDPEIALENTAKQLDKTARKLLNDQDYQQYKDMAADRRAFFREQISQSLSRRIDQAAEGLQPKPEIAADFLLPTGADGAVTGGCGKSSPSAFHYSANSSNCGFFTPYEHDGPATQQARLQSRELIRSALPPWLKDKVTDVPVLVSLGITEPGQNPFIKQDEEQEPQQKDLSLRAYELYLDLQFKNQGCDKNPCILVANKDYTKKKDLEDSLISGSMTPKILQPAKPVSIDDWTLAAEDSNLFTEKEKNPKEKNNIYQIDFVPFIQPFTVVSVDTFEKYMAENPRTRVYTYTAAEAKQLKDNKYVKASRLFSGPADGSSFQTHPDKPLTPQDQGLRMGKELAEYINLVDTVRREFVQQYATQNAVWINQRAAQRATQEFSKKSGEDLETRMGLKTTSSSQK